MIVKNRLISIITKMQRIIAMIEMITMISIVTVMNIEKVKIGMIDDNDDNKTDNCNYYADDNGNITDDNDIKDLYHQQQYRCHRVCYFHHI